MDDDKIDYDDITIDSSDTIDLSNINSSVTISTPWNTMNYGNVTIANGGTSSSQYTIGGAYGTSGAYLTTTSGANGTAWGTPTTPGLKVTGDSTFDGDIKIKGRSLEKLLTKIEDRLAILQDPDPKKLEKYVALKKAYDHYKTLERLIGED
jgi:hypothetical protein